MFQDEAAFRQDPTLYRTWARVGHQPQIFTYGKRNTQHVFGAIAVYTLHFLYKFAEVCNAVTHLKFLEYMVKKFYPNKIFLVIDNARYHKDEQVRLWCKDNKRYIECWFLPPYSPEFNPMESVWKYTRKQGTHNRFFSNTDELRNSVISVFRHINRYPLSIENYILSYK
ncbi:MAG: IS630 family transposase [Elusimicrobiota bacterium]